MKAAEGGEYGWSLRCVGENCITYRTGMAQDRIVANWLQTKIAGNSVWGFFPLRRVGMPEGLKWQETELLLFGAVCWAFL